MKMIIGGACQGKLDYAKRKYPDIIWLDGKTCDEQDIFTGQGMYHFEEYIKRGLQDAWSLEQIRQKIQEQNPEIIIISDEVGYGLVPVDVFERKYRETVGRVCTELAEVSESVDRVVCGIGNRIKG